MISHKNVAVVRYGLFWIVVMNVKKSFWMKRIRIDCFVCFLKRIKIMKGIVIKVDNGVFFIFSYDRKVWG